MGSSFRFFVLVLSLYVRLGAYYRGRRGFVRFAISPPLEIVRCLCEMILVLISLAGITLPAFVSSCSAVWPPPRCSFCGLQFLLLPRIYIASVLSSDCS